MRKPLLFLLISCAAQAQITAYNNATTDNFHGIGGYTYFQNLFPNVPSSGPYVLSGPFPKNDFTCVATSPQGLKGVLNDHFFESKVPNQPLTLTLKGNNVRKMSCVLNLGENIQVTATSNSGTTVSVFAGLNSSTIFNQLTAHET